MSDESLLADVESTPSEESTEQTAEPTWAYAEGLSGEGEPPEWFKADKYKSVAEQAKAYPELAKKLGGFTGAPEEYEVSMPDGIEGVFIEDDPLMGEFKEWAKTNQLNQGAFTDMLHMFVKSEHEKYGANRESELKSLGANAASRLKNIDDYAKANLSDDEYQGILAATTTAAGVKAVEALISKTRGFKIPTDNTETPSGITHSEIKERLNDPRQGSDPEFRAETTKLYEQLFGKEPKRNVIG